METEKTISTEHFAAATVPGTSMVSGAVLAFTVAHESVGVVGR